MTEGDVGDFFECLAVQNAQMLVTFLRSLVRSPDLVEDVFQETMLTAWRNREKFDRTKPFGPWLRGIGVNKVKQLRERQGRDLLFCSDDVMDGLELRFLAADLEVDSDMTQVVDVLLGCLEKLPEKLRIVVTLFYQRGLSFRSIASNLNVSEEAVKKRAQRGRKLLAECMDQKAKLS